MPTVAGVGPLQLGRTILVGDDDRGTLETFSTALRLSGYVVFSECSGASVLQRVRTCRVDAAVVDLRLGDILGTDVLRVLRTEGCSIPFVLISAFLDTPTTTQAMRLGAFDVVDKPIIVDQLCSVVARALAEGSSPAGDDSAGSTRPTHSSHQRLASAMLAVIVAPDDPKTLNDWARLLGMSYTSLRTLYRMFDIPPHNARDLALMLRAVEQSRLQHAAPQAFLDTADERTLDSLFTRAGLDAAVGATTYDLLRTQTFVAAEHPVLKALRALMNH